MFFFSFSFEGFSHLCDEVTTSGRSPGTGKTFVGLRVIQLLQGVRVSQDMTCSDIESFPEDADAHFEGDDPHPEPVLVLAFKNRALDDLLGSCVEVWPKGVSRIGGVPQAGTPLEQHHIRAQMRDSPPSKDYWDARDSARALQSDLSRAATKLSESRYFSKLTLMEKDNVDFLRSLLLNDPSGVINAAAEAEEHEKIRNILEKEDLSELEPRTENALKRWMPKIEVCSRMCLISSPLASERPKTLGGSEAEVEQNERESERSLYRSFSRDKGGVRLEATPGPNSRGVLEAHDPMSDGARLALADKSSENMWALAPDERVLIMHHLTQRQHASAREQYDSALAKYGRIVELVRRLDLAAQVSLLRTKRVVGATISGAAIRRELLEQLRPRTVVVEEAAEVLEPMLLACLGPWVERLVLIGDHSQLPPAVETHKLARDFNFNTSLMERLVANRIPHQVLAFQARMMPEFAALLDDVYPDLRTSKRVLESNRSSPPAGLLESMWWWDVGDESGELMDPKESSYCNQLEESAVAALVAHMLRSGIEPAQITVLAAYSAQVRRIAARLRVVHQREVGGLWPTPEIDGVAAKNWLAASDAFEGTIEHRVARLLELSDTFLKLGDLEGAQEAVHAADKLVKPSRCSAEATEPATIETSTSRIDKMLKCRQTVDGLPETMVAKDAFSEAITELKRLEQYSAQWRSEGAVAACAAASHLRIALTRTLLTPPTAGSKTFEFTDRQKGFLHGLTKSAEKLLDALASQNEVCVSTIDRFQGSENDVVIVSLVRSNKSSDIGFLRERARRVVAQSRARLGMIFVGDARTFSGAGGGGACWANLIGRMTRQGCCSHAISLCCATHRDCIARVVGATAKRAAHGAAQHTDAETIVKNALCRRKCGGALPCGHICKRLCHGGRMEDLHRAPCLELVDDTCAAGHAIQRRCFQIASDCACAACAEVAQAEREREAREWKAREARAREALEQELADIRLRPEKMSKVPIEPYGETQLEYSAIVDRTEKYVQVGVHGSIVVTMVEKVLHVNKTEESFQRAKKELASGVCECNIQRWFHGSSRQGIDGILDQGFRLPEKKESNMLGRGVYFATDASKSAQEMYTKGSGCLLLCDVLAGRVCTVPGLQSKHPLSKFTKEAVEKKGRLWLDVDAERVRKEDYDSVYVPRDTRNQGGVLFDELVVYRPEQAIPRYVVRFRRPLARSQDLKYSFGAKKLPDGVLVHEIRAHELTAGSPHELEFYKAAGQYYHLLGNKSRKVKQVDVYTSPKNEEKYRAQKEELKGLGKSHEETWVFHGTPDSKNVEEICCNGFKVGGAGVDIQNGDTYGRGVYTAQGPDTPISYGDNSSCVILCLGLLGTCDKQEIDDSWRPHSDWIVFKDPAQLLPKYVVHF